MLLVWSTRALAACTTGGPSYAIIDLGAGDETVIGLHITADAIRSGVGLIDEECDYLVFRLESDGGFLAEVPLLADLFAKELSASHEVFLWVEDVSSAAALVALSAPHVVMSEDATFAGHAPFDRLGASDMDLFGDDLDTMLLVAQRCAALGDRPEPVARAMVMPTPLAIDDGGALVEEAEGETALSDGEEVVSLNAEQAQRIGVIDLVVSDEADLRERLGLLPEHEVCATEAKARLRAHRESVSAAITKLDAAIEAFEALLAADHAPGAQEKAEELLDQIDRAWVLTPRIGALKGVDSFRIERFQQRLDAWSDRSP